MTTGVEIGVMHQKAKECQQPVVAERKPSLLEPLEEVQLCQYFDLGPVKLILDFGIEKSGRIIFCCIKTPRLG